MTDSLPPFSNAKKMRARLVEELKIPKYHEDVAAVLREYGLEDSVHYETAVLSQWFRKHGSQLRAGSDSHPNGKAFRAQINAELERRHIYITDSQFRSLCSRFDQITTNPGDVREIIEVLHKVDVIRTNEDLRASWNVERRRLLNKSYRFRDLVAPRGIPPDYPSSPLKGDYLIFRPDAPDHINAAFLRFYGPKDGGVRMMGLRLDIKHDSFGSKGWMTQQPHGALVTNYLVSRAHNNNAVEFDGGNSTIWVPKNFMGVHAFEDVTEAAPCLHWQALSIARPSFACSYMIRLLGYSHQGGSAKMTPEQRHREIMELQNELSFLVRTGFSAKEAAGLLAEQTNLKSKYFETIWKSGANAQPNQVGLPDLSGLSGLEAKPDRNNTWCITREILENR